METDIGSTPETFFRPVKRRKFLRRRVDDEHDDTHDEAKAIGQDNDSSRRHHSISHSSQETDDVAPTTGVVHFKRAYKPRKGGIEFSTTSRQPADGHQTQSVVETTAEDVDDVKIRTMCDRFTVHTGQKVDVDKHMMDYIDSEMARRYQRNLPTDASGAGGPPADEATGGPPTSSFVQREPATLGKLHEIDLGQEAKLQNIARTEAATRKLAGDEVPATDGDSQKIRVGRDGKHWRHRKGRNSEDIERDRLVEEVLRESKLDVYDEPQEEEQHDDQAADDRIAEQFRREFLDAIQSRRRFARARNTKTTKTTAPRGPKLGGSRSARAAMREKQDKSAQK